MMRFILVLLAVGLTHPLSKTSERWYRGRMEEQFTWILLLGKKEHKQTGCDRGLTTSQCPHFMSHHRKICSRLLVKYWAQYKRGERYLLLHLRDIQKDRINPARRIYCLFINSLFISYASGHRLCKSGVSDINIQIWKIGINKRKMLIVLCQLSSN